MIGELLCAVQEIGADPCGGLRRRGMVCGGRERRAGVAVTDTDPITLEGPDFRDVTRRFGIRAF